jgi:hypothetical protein
MHSSFPQGANERAAAAAAVRNAMGCKLRKMYENELSRPLPEKFAVLLSKLDDDTSQAS